MDQTSDQIEAHIDRTRERLGSHLRELGDKVEAATDWREHYRERPHLFLGAAFAGGLVLGAALSARSHGRERGEHAPRPRLLSESGSMRSQAQDMWRNVQLALAGLASARIKDYISANVPGFDEHYRRAEERASSFRPSNAAPRGMAS